ncbi:MAG: GNAT family N-acetyltransferase [Chloroflexi bacterium]|jgi:GNAT superfamily N-acetyltransferase|nr:GNAT family N-acetyltransferase [Chloroflexota bacterium]
MQWQRENFIISDAHSAVDLDFVEAMLRSNYWAPDRPRPVIEAAIRGSIPFSLFDGEQSVGFARAVTDRATFAWIADVMIAPAYRGQGLGKWLIQCVLEHPAIASTATQLLRTRDAHGLYTKFGFEVVESMGRKP